MIRMAVVGLALLMISACSSEAKEEVPVDGLEGDVVERELADTPAENAAHASEGRRRPRRPVDVEREQGTQ